MEEEKLNVFKKELLEWFQDSNCLDYKCPFHKECAESGNIGGFCDEILKKAFGKELQ